METVILNNFKNYKKMEKFEKADLEQFCEMCAKHLAARLLARVIKVTLQLILVH